MFEIVKAGGWLMLPIILCSVVAAAIIAERMWSLQRKRVLPADLAEKVWFWAKNNKLDDNHMIALQTSSPLGQVLAAGLVNRDEDRELIKESIQDTGRHVVHDLERYLNSLGTIAAITPLLGLLGTVIGMVKVFAAITSHGVGNPAVLAGGISEALITTAAGPIDRHSGADWLPLPARSRRFSLVVNMEKEAMKLLESIHTERSGHHGASRPSRLSLRESAADAQGRARGQPDLA